MFSWVSHRHLSSGLYHSPFNLWSLKWPLPCPACSKRAPSTLSSPGNVLNHRTAISFLCSTSSIFPLAFRIKVIHPDFFPWPSCQPLQASFLGQPAYTFALVTKIPEFLLICYDVSGDLLCGFYLDLFSHFFSCFLENWLKIDPLWEVITDLHLGLILMSILWEHPIPNPSTAMYWKPPSFCLPEGSHLCRQRGPKPQKEKENMAESPDNYAKQKKPGKKVHAV